MKIRSGFVSNSSSSSFIVAIDKTEVECPCCKKNNRWILEAMARYLTTLSDKSNKLYTMTSGEQVEEYFKNELLEHMGSKEYAQEQLKTIQELEKDPKAFENYQSLSKQLERARYNTNIAREAAGEKDMAKYLTNEDTLKKRRERIESHIEEYDKKLNDLKTLIRKVRKAVKANKTVYAFTIDNWATDAEKALKEMMRDKVIEVLWEIHT